MDVVIYTRVSTDDQKENGFSLQDQQRRLRLHCKQEGKNIIAHYEDDFSAKDFNRPSFQQMLADLKAKKIRPKQLICVRPDRFSRNFLASFEMISTLKSFGVVLKFIEQDVDLSNPESLIPFALNMILPQVDNERRGLNTKNGMRQAMRQGRWLWKAPVGYTNDTANKKIKIGSDSVYVIRAFKAVAAKLNSADAIRKELNQEGLKCSKQNFLNMLKNPFYMGKILIKEWKNEPEELVLGLHEPIIDAEIFHKVQEVLKQKGKNFPKPSKYKPLFPLRGHLTCEKCGSNLTASSSKGRKKKYPYYHCQHGCKERFEAESANKSFETFLNSFHVNEEIGMLYTEIIKDVYEKEEGSKESRIKEIDLRIEQLIEKLKKIDRKFIDETVSDEDYKRMSSSLKEDIKRLKNDRVIIVSTVTNLQKHFEYGISFLTHLPFYYNNASIEVKHKIIDSIFPEKLIFNGEKYRTTKTNSLVSLICSDSMQNTDDKTKKAIKTDGLSTLAPEAGLEPATL